MATWMRQGGEISTEEETDIFYEEIKKSRQALGLQAKEESLHIRRKLRDPWMKGVERNDGRH